MNAKVLQVGAFCAVNTSQIFVSESRAEFVNNLRVFVLVSREEPPQIRFPVLPLFKIVPPKATTSNLALGFSQTSTLRWEPLIAVFSSSAGRSPQDFHPSCSRISLAWTHAFLSAPFGACVTDEILQ